MTESRYLDGKSAIVTGSIDGIGYATATALAMRGSNVMLNGFADADFIEQRRAAIEKAHGVAVRYNAADLSKPSDIEALVGDAEQNLGPVDILVNNAVTRWRGPLEEIPPEKWDYAIAVNLSAPFHLIRLTLPGMKSRGWGRIVNMASNWGQTGTRDRGDYVATKHGVVGLTRAVALETLEHGITCNAICPGATLTPHAERQINERIAQSGKSREDVLKDFFTARQPSGRFVRPEDVAELIAFLCRDAAREMTGTPISIDGGWLAM